MENDPCLTCKLDDCDDKHPQCHFFSGKTEKIRKKWNNKDYMRTYMRQQRQLKRIADDIITLMGETGRIKIDMIAKFIAEHGVRTFGADWVEKLVR